MMLYHFTAAHFLKSILENGLTSGHTPYRREGEGRIAVGLISGTQWLTTRKDFNQPWCLPAYSNLSYDRNAFRLRVEIPTSHKHLLMTWPAFYLGCMQPKGLLKLQDFDNPIFCDPNNWRVYLGDIHPLWVKDFYENPQPYRYKAQDVVFKAN